MHKLLYILLVMLFAASAEASSFKDEMRKLAKNYSELRSARAELIANKQDSLLPRKQLNPSISGFYSINRERSDNNFSADTQYRTPESYGINLNQVIFDASKYKDIAKGEHQYEAAVNNYYAKEQAIILKAIEVIIAINQAEAENKLNKNNVKALQKQFDTVQIEYDSEVKTITDLNQAKSRLALAKARQKLSQTKLNSAKKQYKRVFGSAPKKAINLHEYKGKLNELKREFVKQNNFEILSYNAQLEASKKDVEIAQSNFYPTVELNASAQKQVGASAFGSNFDNEDYSAGIRVNVPIYQRGIEYTQLKSAKARHEQLQADYDNFVSEKLIEAEIEYGEYEAAFATYNANKSAVDANKIALESIREEYKNDTRTTLDVLDQEQELLQANLDLLNSDNDILRKHFQLRAINGKLTLKHLLDE